MVKNIIYSFKTANPEVNNALLYTKKNLLDWNDVANGGT